MEEVLRIHLGRSSGQATFTAGAGVDAADVTATVVGLLALAIDRFGDARALVAFAHAVSTCAAAPAHSVIRVLILTGTLAANATLNALPLRGVGLDCARRTRTAAAGLCAADTGPSFRALRGYTVEFPHHLCRGGIVESVPAFLRATKEALRHRSGGMVARSRHRRAVIAVARRTCTARLELVRNVGC